MGVNWCKFDYPGKDFLGENRFKIIKNCPK